MPKDDRSTPPVLTVAELICLVEARTDLTQMRRRDLASDLAMAARLIGLPPSTLPADAAVLVPRLRAVHPIHAGISKGRLANIRSSVRQALRLAGLTGAGRDRIALGPAWSAALARAPDRYFRMRLVRFARFCESIAVLPEAVDQSTAEAFRAAVWQTTLAEGRRHAVRKAITAWNDAVRMVLGWPQTRLAVPHPQAHLRYALPLTAFPESFQEDVARWRDRLSGARALFDEGPVRPLRPATVESHAILIRQAASALVASGRDPATIRSLAALVTREAAEAILTFHHARGERRPCPSTVPHRVARLLLTLARHHVQAEDATVAALKRYVARLRPTRGGLTLANQKRLTQFDDERNVARLLHLPARLMGEAEREGLRPDRRARAALFAVAIEVLLHCPIRLANLVSLDLERHLVRSGHGRGARVHLRIEGEAVKNGEPIQFLLPPALVAMLDRYVALYRPVFADPRDRCLFPAPGGGPRSAYAFSNALIDVVWREAGLRVTTHGFRHIAAKLHLDRYPGDYETVRRILGHRSIDTTTNAYTGFDTLRAGKHFDQVLQRRRRETALIARVDRRRRR